jgi:hypothetical protein
VQLKCKQDLSSLERFLLVSLLSRIQSWVVGHAWAQTRDTLKGKQAMGTTSIDKSRRVGSVLAAEE